MYAIRSYYVNDNALTLGVGGSLKYIRPSLYTVGINPFGPDNQKYLSDALLRSLSAVGYLNYKKEMLFFQAKAVLGQNMTHLTMPGGYGVKSVDAATGAMEYTPYTTMTTYINAVYGKTYQVGIFAGSMNVITSYSIHYTKLYDVLIYYQLAVRSLQGRKTADADLMENLRTQRKGLSSPAAHRCPDGRRPQTR